MVRVALHLVAKGCTAEVPSEKERANVRKYNPTELHTSKEKTMRMGV